jgi:RNA methyltransferase, TrmH family
MDISAEQGPRTIESRQNPRVKELRAYLRRGANKDGERIAIEGEHLLGEAVRSGLRIRTVFVRKGNEDLLGDGLPGMPEVLVLAPEVFSSAVSTDNPQGIAALVDAPRFEIARIFQGIPLVVVAAGLQDPGNLGTLVRSAEGFGATGMILLPGTVSVWNPKALRASSGSAFRFPAVSMAPENAFALMRAHGVRLLAAVPRDGDSLSGFSGPVAFLLGNEGAGLPKAWLDQSDARVTIPNPGRVESLNAAVAGSVLLYEAARQRQKSGFESGVLEQV